VQLARGSSQFVFTLELTQLHRASDAQTATYAAMGLSLLAQLKPAAVRRSGMSTDRLLPPLRLELRVEKVRGPSALEPQALPEFALRPEAEALEKTLRS